MAIEKLLRFLELPVSSHGPLTGEDHRVWKEAAKYNPQLISSKYTLEEALFKFRTTLIKRSIIENGFNLMQTAKALEIDYSMLVRLTSLHGTREFHDRSFLDVLGESGVNGHDQKVKR